MAAIFVSMNPQQEEILRLYMDILKSPVVRWLTWISIASVVLVSLVAWRKGLRVWTWFLYSMLLGPVALVHILFKSRPDLPPESPGAL